MTKKLSRNHHYIPQFHLRGFYLEKDFTVFDKKYNKFENRPHTASMIMFEKDRNITLINGNKTDQIEMMYSRLETSWSDLFKLLQGKEYPHEILSPQGISLLRQYISIQFWRLPFIDDFANNLLRTLDLKAVPSPILIDGKKMGEIPKLQELLRTDPSFRYYYRCFYCPLVFNPSLWFNTNISSDELQHWKIFDVEEKANWANHIIGDFPFVFRNIDNLLLFNDDFIFPLTRSRVLIRFKEANSPISIYPGFSSKLSALIFGQSNRYIAGPNKEYISNVIDLYRKYWNDEKITTLKEEVLKDLYKS